MTITAAKSARRIVDTATKAERKTSQVYHYGSDAPLTPSRGARYSLFD